MNTLSAGKMFFGMLGVLVSMAAAGQAPGLKPMKVNIVAAADSAALTVKGAVVIAEETTGGSPRTSAVEIGQDGRIKEWLLFVEKGIVTSRMCVDTVSGWADDVFETGYPVRSLAGVETFIEKNGHLPGIPPAEEVKRDGYEVPEMQQHFLRKIEELTLHQIRQQEQIVRLRSVIAPYEALERRLEAVEEKYFPEVADRRGRAEEAAPAFGEAAGAAPSRAAETPVPMARVMSASGGAVGVNLTGLEPGVAMNMSGRMVILDYDDTRDSIPDFENAPSEIFCVSCEPNSDGSPGSWSPKDDFLLFVKGGIVSNDWVCRDLAENWADYVFDDHYDLMSLEEEKTYINKYGHLPGVPSAAQVAGGYELSEMSAILMAEIEERFLHLFQQHEELKKLEGRLRFYSGDQWMKDISKRLDRLDKLSDTK